MDNNKIVIVSNETLRNYGLLKKIIYDRKKPNSARLVYWYAGIGGIAHNYRWHTLLCLFAAFKFLETYQIENIEYDELNGFGIEIIVKADETAETLDRDGSGDEIGDGSDSSDYDDSDYSDDDADDQLDSLAELLQTVSEFTNSLRDKLLSFDNLLKQMENFPKFVNLLNYIIAKSGRVPQISNGIEIYFRRPFELAIEQEPESVLKLASQLDTDEDQISYPALPRAVFDFILERFDILEVIEKWGLKGPVFLELFFEKATSPELHDRLIEIMIGKMQELINTSNQDKVLRYLPDYTVFFQKAIRWTNSKLVGNLINTYTALKNFILLKQSKSQTPIYITSCSVCIKQAQLSALL